MLKSTPCIRNRNWDGGKVNGYGRSLPTGGLLDLGTGQWAPLPKAPAPGDGRYRALSRNWITAAEGLVFDTTRVRWLPLPDHDLAVAEGEAAAWVGERLVVWGGGKALHSADGNDSPVTATGAVWAAGG